MTHGCLLGDSACMAEQDDPQLLHRPDLLAEGYADAEIQRAIRDGRLIRVGAGSYCRPMENSVRMADDLYRLRVLAAARRAPGLVACRESALAIYRMPLLQAETLAVHQIRTGRTGGLRSARRVVHVGLVPEAIVISVDQVRVLSLARSLVDHACSASLESAVVPMDEALGLELVTVCELEAALRAVRGRRGCGNARRAVAMASGRCESVGETRLRVRMKLMGLPTPQLQVNIFDRQGKFIGRVDALIPECALIIEFDGKQKYLKRQQDGESASEAVYRERRRESKLLALGYVVIRVIWSELFDLGKLKQRFLADMATGRLRMELGGPTGSTSLAAYLRGKERPGLL